MPTIQEQLEKIEKDFDERFKGELETEHEYWYGHLKMAKQFLRTSALELVKSVVEGIKGQEDLERLKETLKQL